MLKDIHRFFLKETLLICIISKIGGVEDLWPFSGQRRTKNPFSSHANYHVPLNIILKLWNWEKKTLKNLIRKKRKQWIIANLKIAGIIFLMTQHLNFMEYYYQLFLWRKGKFYVIRENGTNIREKKIRPNLTHYIREQKCGLKVSTDFQWSCGCDWAVERHNKCWQ